MGIPVLWGTLTRGGYFKCNNFSLLTVVPCEKKTILKLLKCFEVV